MLEINNYQINDQSNEKSVDKIIFNLAQKCFANNLKTLIIVESDMVDHIDRMLWCFSKNEFLPHSTYKDPEFEIQPILIANKLDNLDNYNAIIIVNFKEALNNFLEYVKSIDLKIIKCTKLLIIQNSLFNDLNNAKIIVNNHIQKNDGGWQKK